MSLSFTLFHVSSLHNQDLGLAPTKKRAWTPSANFFGTWTFPTSDIFASDQTPGQHNCAHQLCLDVHHDFMCWTHVLNAGTLKLMCATHTHTENIHTHTHPNTPTCTPSQFLPNQHHYSAAITDQHDSCASTCYTSSRAMRSQAHRGAAASGSPAATKTRGRHVCQRQRAWWPGHGLLFICHQPCTKQNNSLPFPSLVLVIFPFLAL